MKLIIIFINLLINDVNIIQRIVGTCWHYQLDGINFK